MVEADLRLSETEEIGPSGISGASNFLIPLKGMPFHRSLGSEEWGQSGILREKGVRVNKPVRLDMAACSFCPRRLRRRVYAADAHPCDSPAGTLPRGGYRTGSSCRLHADPASSVREVSNYS